jgi:peptidoglycan-associated lipoprotein
MITRKTGDEWSTAQLIDVKNEESDDVTTAGHPAFTTDETHIIFASDMPGGLGGKDLWIAPFDKGSMTAGEAVNLGPSINTAGDEMFPFVRKNGALYFASTGHPGMGGFDIFSAETSGDNTWANVVNMGYPINSVGHDFGIIWEGDSERGYFSSDRRGGKGKDDIYSFNLPPLLFALEGVVYDKESQQPVPEATIKVIGSDGSSFEALSDAGGAFGFAEKGEERYINPETNYSIEVSKTDYLVAKDQISTVGIPESTTFLKEYFITFTAPDVAIEFPEVRYAYNKAELQVNEEVNSLDSLDFLYNVLVDNPTIIIELQAHTDSRGKDAYNKDLSQRRAESCVNYLISKGIPDERMVAKGYGETKLRITDKQIAGLSTEEEKEAAHQKNRRTEFTVLSFDYIPIEDTDN